MNPKLRDYARQQDRAIRDMNALFLRKDVGPMYWPVRIVPWAIGVSVAIWVFVSMLPVTGWFELLLSVPFSAYIGALAAAVPQILLTYIGRRLTRRDR